MARHLLAMFCLLTSATTAFAQSIGTEDVKTAAPAKMFSYLVTDMRVGIKNIEGTASVTLNVYTKEDYELALATKNPSQALSNPMVQRELVAYMKRNGLDDSAAGRTSLVPPMRIVFGRIDAIGDDYLLIGLDGDIKSEANATSRRRRIIPKSSIGSIDLDTNPIRFITHPERKSLQTGG